MTEYLQTLAAPPGLDPSPEITPPSEGLPSPEVPSGPVETLPPGDVGTPQPTESLPGATTGSGATSAGTQVPANTAPVSAGLPAWGWACIGLMAGLILGVLLTMLFRKKQAPAPARIPSTVEPPSKTVSPPVNAVPRTLQVQTLSPKRPEVAKVHEQGARNCQQDSFFVSPDGMYTTHGLLAVVADGMGGLADGEKVSQAVATAMMSGFYDAKGTPEQVLLTLLKQAMSSVDSLLGPDGFRRSGSTLVAGLIRDGAFHYMSVGDSHIYLWRDGALYLLNRDHVFRNDLYLQAVNGAGTIQEAARHPKGGGLTSYLGMGPLKYIDLPGEPIAVRPGDRFLLVSDGIYNALPGRELEDLLNRSPDRMADALLEAVRAKNYSNQDNYTAVVLSC